MSMSETFDTMISYVAENAVPLAIAFVAGAGTVYAYNKIVVDDNGNVKKLEAPKEEPKKDESKGKEEKPPISKKELKKELKKLLEEADEKGVDVKKILNDD